MRAVLQRVHSASVISDGVPTGSCGEGLLILLGVKNGDTEEDALVLAEKVSKTRIFTDANGKMNLSVKDIGGGALVVSNFTLYAEYRHGNRPDFLNAAEPAVANRLYEHFKTLLSERIGSVEAGVFGAHMEIQTVLNGPVTVVMESEHLKKRE